MRGVKGSCRRQRQKLSNEGRALRRTRPAYTYLLPSISADTFSRMRRTPPRCVARTTVATAQAATPRSANIHTGTASPVWARSFLGVSGPPSGFGSGSGAIVSTSVQAPGKMGLIAGHPLLDDLALRVDRPQSRAGKLLASRRIDLRNTERSLQNEILLHYLERIVLAIAVMEITRLAMSITVGRARQRCRKQPREPYTRRMRVRYPIRPKRGRESG